MSATQFKYDDLQTDTSIRLFKVKPCSKADVEGSNSGSHHGLVSCILKQFSDNIPPYSALSYCWGDTKRDRQLMYLEKTPIEHHRTPVEVHETLIEVHKTLWEFLDEMQSPEHAETWFWTDFLCLNQDNKDEKATQIPRMGTIYAEAKETISWLGREAPSANQHVPNLGDSLRLIETRASVPATRDVVQKFFERLPNWTTIMKHKTSGMWPRIREESDQTNLAELEKLERQTCRFGFGQFGVPLNGILSLPYWTRVWIVQEVAVGSHVRLTYGSVSIDLEDFFLAYKCHLYHLMKSNQGNTSVPAGTSAAMQARAARLDEDISVYRVLQWGRLCDSTRIHDRIYGLLGLLGSYGPRGSSTSGLLKVDYERDITSVFWDVVFECRTPIKEEADGSDLIYQFLEITGFFPSLARSLRCSHAFSVQSLLSYFDEGDLSLHKKMTKRMVSTFQSVGGGIFLSTSIGIYADSTHLLKSLRMRSNPDPDPDWRFQSLESDLATIFLECVDSGIDQSAEIHAALIALRLAQRDDLGSGHWSCVPSQDQPGDDDKSGGKRKILERQVRWTSSVPAPSPDAASRCSLANRGDHRCHGSSLYLSLPDLGWNLRLDIQHNEDDEDDEDDETDEDDEEDEDWIYGTLSIILNSTFSQQKYGHLVFKN